jgi:hypothetical protein
VIRTRFAAIAAVALMLSLSGCMPSDQSGDPTSVTTTEEGGAVESELTWQEAKARTLAMQLEIAELIPEAKVVKIHNKKTGTLLSCSETQHRWKGSNTVTLTEGTEPEPLVRAIEAHFQDSRFHIEAGIDNVGNYEVQLRSLNTAENYIVAAGWDPDTIRIDSGSPCFTLPEGVYPGGEF